MDKETTPLQTETVASSARLRNAVAVVTGGASGIGHGIATEFALEGAAVAILDLNRSMAEQVVNEIKGRSTRQSRAWPASSATPQCW